MLTSLPGARMTSFSMLYGPEKEIPRTMTAIPR